MAIENISKVAGSLGMEQMLGDALRSGDVGGAGFNARVEREMRSQGLPVPSGANGEATPGASFSDLFRQSIDKVNVDQHQADVAIKELVAGRNKNIHETMLAIERADSSLKLMMQVRNKVLDAYREIMRMQV